MKTLLRTSAAISALLCSSLTAFAADWTGPYVGAYYAFGIDGIGSDFAGIQAGYNFAGSGNLIFGVEADYGWATNGAGEIWALSGRIAAEVAPDLLLFGSVGYGEATPATSFTTGAIGMQYAITPAFALRASVDGYWPTGGGTTATAGKLGVLYSF